MMRSFIFLSPLILILATTLGAADGRPPNVVIVMTDDQGYGDLSCHGNPDLATPHIDELYADSVRLSDYHVDPTCSPTRAALLTGRYSSRTGVWHTIQGRSLIDPTEWTMAEAFSSAGYRTGIFGKWHLGDNHPCLPGDQGFQSSLVHGGGGVGQTPDSWGNDYFDDVYWRDGKTVPTKGYCTDVFFAEAMEFVEKNAKQPFLCYIPTNAAHGPYLVADRYAAPFKEAGIPSPRAEFYGMIVNIDENVGRLRALLERLEIADDTIFIFCTDNGTAEGARDGGFNSGMRGSKGSEFDGGHRVPFFLHWPAGEMVGGREVDSITAHIDVLPTLLELCKIPQKDGNDLDGKSLVPLLTGHIREAWPDRTLFVHSQRIEHPEKWRKSSVMTDRWRLINGKQLFDIVADPDQSEDVAGINPSMVRQLRSSYERWWNHIGDRFDDVVRIRLGGELDGPARLTGHDWHSPTGGVPWHQNTVRRDRVCNGHWSVEVVRAGRYQITLSSRPAGHEVAMGALVAGVQIGDVKSESVTDPAAGRARLIVNLAAGPASFRTWLRDGEGKERGAYFAEVLRIPGEAQ